MGRIVVVCKNIIIFVKKRMAKFEDVGGSWEKVCHGEPCSTNCIGLVCDAGSSVGFAAVFPAMRGALPV